MACSPLSPSDQTTGSRESARDNVLDSPALVLLAGRPSPPPNSQVSPTRSERQSERRSAAAWHACRVGRTAAPFSPHPACLRARSCGLGGGKSLKNRGISSAAPRVQLSASCSTKGRPAQFHYDPVRRGDQRGVRIDPRRGKSHKIRRDHPTSVAARVAPAAGLSGQVVEAGGIAPGGTIPRFVALDLRSLCKKSSPGLSWWMVWCLRHFIASQRRRDHQ